MKLICVNSCNSWIIFVFILTGITSSLFAQHSIPDSLLLLFDHQLAVFPQEKIYLHTDKPYYISGERIWFRAHLADAVSHAPVSVSRYVYVELIDPRDSIVTRVKIGGMGGAYQGCLLIPDTIPEGDYTLRAYTTFMRSQSEHYFFTKTIRISDPLSRSIHVAEEFTFSSGRRERVDGFFRISHITPSGSFEPFVPQTLKVGVNNGQPMHIKVGDDGTATFHFNLPAASRRRTVLLEVVSSSTIYRKMVRIPTPDDDFDVTFYPEGGSLMSGTKGKVAFKAMKSNGQATGISGKVYDNEGNEITEIRTEHLGMGSFSLLPEKGKTFYAVCENEKGYTKRFQLPAAIERGITLSVNQMKNRIILSALQPAESASDGDYYLLAHTRGKVHFVSRWDVTKNLVFEQDQFPSGVMHWILFDSGRNPVSERLIFINNNDQTQTTCQPDSRLFTARSLVTNRVTVTDNEGRPLTGSFSVAVTSDREVTPDSTSNILTQLLLTSDLRGNIENPAGYFQNNTSSAYMLDLLMCTQGWRRYHITEVAHGRLSEPSWPLELSSEISGTVNRLLTGKPAEHVEVTMMSSDGKYFDNTRTDKDGRFYLHGGEFPDSTWFIVDAVPQKGLTRMELTIDRETYPERTLPTIPPAEINRIQLVKYADKAELLYKAEGGMRMYILPEVSVTAVRPQRLVNQSPFYSPELLSTSCIITEEVINRFHFPDIFTMLTGRIAGVTVTAKHEIYIRGVIPLIVVDNMITDIRYLDVLSLRDIARIDVLKDAYSCAGFGSMGAHGVIVIYTKIGDINREEFPPFHIKTMLPLGHQPPVEFYAPKYDTPEKRKAPDPDLRTTIHWQPVVQTDTLGEASFEFYTADEPIAYTVVIEGLTADGRIIRQEKKLSWR